MIIWYILHRRKTRRARQFSQLADAASPRDPEKPGETIDIDTITSYPYPLQSLVDEEFRAVRVAAGDSISAAISDKGELRVWGSFRVSSFDSVTTHLFTN